MTDLSKQPFDPRRFLDRFGGAGHNAAIGIEYFDHGADWVELSMEAGRRDLDGTRISGGPTITLLDIAGTLAVWAWIGRTRPLATLGLRMEYLAAIPSQGSLRARARCKRSKGDIIFVDAVATACSTNDDFARSSATYIFTGQ